MNLSKSIIAFVIILLSISNVFCQKQILSRQLIGADKRTDSLFRNNFFKLENYKQIFIVKQPGFSLTEFNEPENKEIYKFVELLILLSEIPCDSTIYQVGWKHEYCTWEDAKIEEWELWYNKNAKKLNYQEVLCRKNAIDNKWDIK